MQQRKSEPPRFKQTNLCGWKVRGGSDSSYPDEDSYHESDEEDLGPPAYWTRVKCRAQLEAARVVAFDINKDLKAFHIQERRRGDQRPNGNRPYFDSEEWKGTGYRFQKATARLPPAKLLEVAETVAALRREYRQRAAAQALVEQGGDDAEAVEEIKEAG